MEGIWKVSSHLPEGKEADLEGWGYIQKGRMVEGAGLCAAYGCPTGIPGGIRKGLTLMQTLWATGLKWKRKQTGFLLVQPLLQ